MKKDHKLDKEKIKNWFIVQRIRLTNFIKEHKYISAGIGVFILTGIIALVAFAQNNELVNISSFNVDAKSSDVSNSTFYSFDTISYNLNSITFSNNDNELSNMEVTATISSVTSPNGFEYTTSNIDAEWIQGDEDSDITYTGSDKRTALYRFYEVNTNSPQNYNVYLKVNNVKAGTKIKVTLTANTKNVESSEVIISNVKEVTLTPKIINGNAYKDSNFTGGRYASFGILLGIKQEDLNEGSLKGIYFDPNKELTLGASQIVSNTKEEIELETENNYYGLYQRSMNLLDMPNYIYNDDNSLAVFNSGSVTLSKKENNDSSVTANNQVRSKDFRLSGPAEIKLEQGETYEELGATTNNSKVCPGNDCTITYYKRTSDSSNYTTLDNSNQISEVGTYKVNYKYEKDNSIVTIDRKVVVENKNVVSEEVDGRTISLNGKSKYVFPTGHSLQIPSIPLISSDNTSVDYSEEIKKSDGTVVSQISIIQPEVYTITYTVRNTNVKFTRTVEYVDSYTPAKQIVAEDIYINKSDSYIPYIKIIYTRLAGPGTESEVYQKTECVSSNNCSVSGEFNPNKIGTYNVTYTYTDENGYVIKITRAIHVQTKYTLKVNGISTNDIYYKTEDGFVGLGSYFVNAKSVRSSGDQSDISVTLNVDGLESTPIINHNVAEGTKTNSLELYDSEDEEKYTSDDYLAYGEDVVLRSTFKYLNDGDNNISSLTTTNPVAEGTSTSSSKNYLFDMTEYYNNIDDNNTPPHYIEVNDTKIESYDAEGNLVYSGDNIGSISIKYNACVINTNSSSCSGAKTSYDTYSAYKDAHAANNFLRLASITYTVTNVKPGTTIDFRTRLLTSIGNNGKITLTSEANYGGNASLSVNVTPFKARTSVSVDDHDYDVSIDAANKNSSVLTILPSVTMPAGLIDTTAAGISELSNVQVVVTLPEGVNYSYNDNYDKPVVSGKTLTYNIKGKSINDWFDPIYVDVYYDVNISNGSTLDIKSVIQATATNGIVDSSSETARTTTRKVTYLNSDDIAASLYTPYTGVSQNQAFDIVAKMYNNTENKKDAEMILILPYNDISKEENSFSGSYTLENVDDDMLCTTSLPTIVDNPDNIKNVTNSEIEWSKCSNYKNNNYAGVTAIGMEAELNKGDSYSKTIKIVPSGNIADDSYIIGAYVLYDPQIIKSIKPLKVSVVSKKITGTVWEDFDSNGIMDEDEKKLSDVTFNLHNASNDEIVATTVSNSKGVYSFSGLEPGSYYVTTEFNTSKYGITTYAINYDKSTTSAFKSDKGNNVVQTENEENEQTEEISNNIIKTDTIEVTEDTRVISNINLGLSLRKVYSVKLTKFVTSATTTNAFGLSTTKEYGNVSLAKLDVKDINNLSIKVVYTIELENVGYFPGYIYEVKDYVPDGMEFNPNYVENEGWFLNSDGYVENKSLSDTLINGGEKKYLTIAFDITRKEAGSFINYASVDDDDLQILVIANQNDGGDK